MGRMLINQHQLFVMLAKQIKVQELADELQAAAGRLLLALRTLHFFLPVMKPFILPLMLFFLDLNRRQGS